MDHKQGDRCPKCGRGKLDYERGDPEFLGCSQFCGFSVYAYRSVAPIQREYPTHCVNGHPLDEANLKTYINLRGQDTFQCRQCLRDARERQAAGEVRRVPAGARAGADRREALGLPGVSAHRAVQPRLCVLHPL